MPGAAVLPVELFVWPGAEPELPCVDVVVWPGFVCLTVCPGAVAVPDPPELPLVAFDEPPDVFPLVAPVVLAAGAPLAGVEATGVAACVDDGPPDVDEEPVPEEPDDEWRPCAAAECCPRAAPGTLLPTVRDPVAVVAEARPVSEPEEALAAPPLAVVGVSTAVWAGWITGGADWPPSLLPSGRKPAGRMPRPARPRPTIHSRKTNPMTRPMRASMRARRPVGSARTGGPAGIA